MFVLLSFLFPFESHFILSAAMHFLTLFLIKQLIKECYYLTDVFSPMPEEAVLLYVVFNEAQLRPLLGLHYY